MTREGRGAGARTEVRVVGQDQQVRQAIVPDLLGRVGRERGGDVEHADQLLRPRVRRLGRLLRRLELALQQPRLERVADDAAGGLRLELERGAQTEQRIASNGRVLGRERQEDEGQAEADPGEGGCRRAGARSGLEPGRTG